MESRETPEVLISDRDGLLPVNTLNERSKAVCYIQITLKDPRTNRDKLRRGSGFYSTVQINDKEYHGIFTNNHVLSKETEAQGAEAIFGYVSPNEGKRVSLRPDLIFRTNKELDYSFVGVQKEDIESLQLGIFPIQFQPEPRISEGDEILILQHPKGRPQEFSHDRIIGVESPFLYYKADTETGSSGAPVFLKLKLVAIHQKGSEELNYNKGVLCSEILSHLSTGKYTKPNIYSLPDSQGKEIDEDNRPRKRQRMEKDIFLIPSENVLNSLAADIITIWKHLGRKLGLGNSKIEEISRDNINYVGIREKAFQMLMCWKDSSPNPSYCILGEALVELGKRNLAQQYCGLL